MGKLTNNDDGIRTWNSDGADLVSMFGREISRIGAEGSHCGKLLQLVDKLKETIEAEFPEYCNMKLDDLFAGFDPDEHEMLTMDGYNDCIVGVVERFGQNPIVCYDKERVIQRLESDGMNRDEAEEFFYFNQLGAWMGDSTPCFLSANQ